MRAGVEERLAELRDTLHGIYLLRHCPLQALDMTASFGERLSALIIAAHLNQSHPAIFVDSRQLVITDDQFTHATVQFARTNRAMRAHFAAAASRRRGAAGRFRW